MYNGCEINDRQVKIQFKQNSGAFQGACPAAK